MSGRTLMNWCIANERTKGTTTGDKIAGASVVAFALFTLCFWTYAELAEWRAQHGYLPPLAAPDPALFAFDDSDADEPLASGGSGASDPTRP